MNRDEIIDFYEEMSDNFDSKTPECKEHCRTMLGLLALEKLLEDPTHLSFEADHDIVFLNKLDDFQTSLN